MSLYDINEKYKDGAAAMTSEEVNDRTIGYLYLAALISIAKRSHLMNLREIYNLGKEEGAFVNQRSDKIPSYEAVYAACKYALKSNIKIKNYISMCCSR